MKFFLKALLIVFIMGGSIPTSSFAQKKEYIKVMTSNIRMASKGDGINYWDNRRDWYADFVKFEDVDIFGAQEVLYSQLTDIQDRLPDYAHIGVGREGENEGEFSPIFYKKDKYEVLKSETFWLSLTPNEVGSKGWDAALPRIVTWAKFKSKETGEEFYFFNTHFDHVGEEARKQSAAMIKEKVGEVAGKLPVFVTGDFNVPPANAPYQELTSGKNKMKDTFNEAPKKYGPSYTFNGFELEPDTERDRIDYIFFNGKVSILSYQVMDGQRGKRYISDHFPIIVEAELK
ncbi:endonuclease/exonuclease/phosphatase family protein [Fulvivirga sediminis]|uniref:Endonuclease/exonuclease/phosphatase family protein n=1 Tax=Fulvivirga sediminis TaxID=2803949 RepID=A0A937JZE3_9BACT|nr:endonuclease/exonuclease/phosphatase family protein [Fulvivirga sediminis]MBL3657323.1 endonuclease/exonuclease/phosphatase family protein [Fulvivirga sediminis]